VITLLFRVFGVPHRRHVVILLGCVIAVVLIGAELFALAESLPFTTGLYWAVTTFAIVSGAAAAAGVRRILAMHSSTFPEGTYRLIVGMTPAVPAILDELAGAGVPVVLVADVDPGTVRSGVHVVRGKPTDEAVIARAKPAGAEQALITGGSDGDVLVSAVMLRKQAPSLVITALVDSPSVREALRDLGVQQSVSTSELVARTLAASLETPHAGEMISQLVGNRDALAEVEAGTAALGKRLSAVRSERLGLVLGLVRDGEFTLGLSDDPVIASGDRLLVAEARGV
jgi:voltage-gated potassium channel